MDDSQWLVDIPSIEYSEQTSTRILDGDDSIHIPSIKLCTVVLVSTLSYCSDDEVCRRRRLWIVLQVAVVLQVVVVLQVLVVVVLHRRPTRAEIVLWLGQYSRFNSSR